MYFYSTPTGLRRRLQGTADVQKAKKDLSQGLISEDTIERFVTHIMGDLERGQKFKKGVALSAIAVVLEDRPTAFADSFIKDLSDLKILELSLPVGVAKEVAKYRTALARSSLARPEIPGQMSYQWSGERTPIIILGGVDFRKRTDSASPPKRTFELKTA